MREVSSWLVAIKWTDFATYFSVFLTIIIFFYQEFSFRKDGKRASESIIHEMTDLVIRNHASNRIDVRSIDMKYLVNGFEQLKKCKINISFTTFLMTVYAKVYSNEHITESVRRDLMNQLDEQLSDLEEYEETTDKDNKIKVTWSRRNEIVISVICLLLLTIFLELIMRIDFFNERVLLTTVIILSATTLTIFFIKPALITKIGQYTDKLIEQHKRIREIHNERDYIKRETARIKRKKLVDQLEKDTSNGNSIKNGKEQAPKISSKFVLEEYFPEEAVKIREIFELRLVFELKVRDIYNSVFVDHTNLPLFKILRNLVSCGILTEEEYINLRKSYSYSSRVVHTGEVSDDSFANTYDKVIAYLNVSINDLNNYINSEKYKEDKLRFKMI